MIPIALDVRKGPEQLFDLLKIVRPNWKSDLIKFSTFSNGTVNKLIACYVNDDKTILVRINGDGSDLFIDREKEIRYLKVLEKKKLAAKLFATFKNGLVYEFVPGNVVTIETVSEPTISSLIARRMALMHRTVRPTPDLLEGNDLVPWMWIKLKSMYEVVPEKFSDPIKQERFEKQFKDKTFLKNEIDFLSKHLANCDNDIVFCHNDLLVYNIIHNKELNSVQFIDYEFADFNYQAFDIGNHFGEFSGIDLLDFKRYPNEEFQKNWLQIYLQEYYENEYYDNEQELNKLLNWVNKFYLASHLLWTVFGLYQAEISQHSDTDFLLMTQKRIEDYFQRKHVFLK